MNLAIIGGGNMGGAIARALVHRQILAPTELLIVDPNPQIRDTLQELLGCQVVAEINEVISAYETILIAVKPQMASEVLPSLKPFLEQNPLILSIMAGVSVQSIQQWLKHFSVVRVMPNTPAQIGEGVSVYFADPVVSELQKIEIQSLFNAVGVVLEVKEEDLIDAATAISGSGPGYVFYWLEFFLASAQSLGFSAEEAAQLVQQTVHGSLELWKSSSQSLQQLRTQVTSPGGTTQTALEVFERQELGPHFQEGIQAAYHRAKALK